MSWIQIATAVILPVLAVIVGYFTGRRSRSITVATTVEKEWLNTVAEDLAEFIEVQYDIVWKRWRLKDLELTGGKEQSSPYDKESFRELQDACWKQTFRSDFLKTKLSLILDDTVPLQARLIQSVEEYSQHADLQDKAYEQADKNKLTQIAVEIGDLLRVQHKPAIVAAGRRVLEAKRKEIRKSI